MSKAGPSRHSGSAQSSTVHRAEDYLQCPADATAAICQAEAGRGEDRRTAHKVSLAYGANTTML